MHADHLAHMAESDGQSKGGLLTFDLIVTGRGMYLTAGLFW